MNKIVLLTGATGGIGGPLLEELIRDDAVEHIVATSRTGMGSVHAKVSWVALDYLYPSTIGKLVHLLRSKTQRLDALLCATGSLQGEYGQPEKTVTSLELASMQASFTINAAGPLALFAECSALLKSAQSPIALFLSAQVGSIEDNALGGWFSYRMAKAALNMGVKTAAIEAARWRNDATVIAVHPGTTITNLSRPYVRSRKHIRQPDDTAGRIYQLMGELDSANNGDFLTSDGAVLPW